MRDHLIFLPHERPSHISPSWETISNLPLMRDHLIFLPHERPSHISPSWETISYFPLMRDHLICPPHERPSHISLSWETISYLRPYYRLSHCQRGFTVTFLLFSQPGGSAHDSGGLKVGHLVLEVNGKSLRNLEHQQCAKLIAEAFKNKKAGHLELLVLDPEAGNVRFWGDRPGQLGFFQYKGHL